MRGKMNPQNPDPVVERGLGHRIEVVRLQQELGGRLLPNRPAWTVMMTTPADVLSVAIRELGVVHSTIVRVNDPGRLLTNRTLHFRQTWWRHLVLSPGRPNAGAHPPALTIPPAPVGCSALLGGSSDATLLDMTIKARVRAGRLVLDEPTDLPEGAEVELLPLDPGDWLDEADRAALHQALHDSDVDVARDRLVDAEEILRELRAR